MTTYLLDVNVLIALVDAAHVQHDAAHAWFAKVAQPSWATCPLTENAFLRIMGAATYPGRVGDPMSLRILLKQMCAFPGHQFWADTVLWDAIGASVGLGACQGRSGGS